MTEQSLDQILNNEEVKEEVVETPAVETPEAEAEPEVEAQAEPQEQGDDKGEPPAPDKTEQDNPFFHKAQDEKKKRQAKEQENEQLRADLAAERAARNVQSNPEPEAVAEPDPLDDPEGFRKHLKDQHEAARISDRINLSYEMAVDTSDKDTVDAAIAKYTEMAQADPDLVRKARASVRPVNFMMKHVAKVERNTEIDNIDDWKAKETAKIRAELLAESEGKQTAKDELISSIPESLANEGSAPTGKASKVVVDKPLEDILPSIN